MGLFQRLLELGAACDITAPADILIKETVGGRNPARFEVSWVDGASGRDIERMLKRNGIRTWGLIPTRGSLCFTVDMADAEKARKLLSNADVRVLAAPPEAWGDDTKSLRNAGRVVTYVNGVKVKDTRR
jgi:hypothetical protein